MNTRIPSRMANGVTPFLFAAFALAGSLHGGERIGLVGEVHAGYLLGGARNGFWMEADMARECVSPGVAFKTYALDGPCGRAPVKAKLIPGSEPCPDTVRLDFASDDARSEPVLAVSCPWNPAPRKTTVCDPANKTYQNAAAAVLKAAGVTKPQVRVNPSPTRWSPSSISTATAAWKSSATAATTRAIGSTYSISRASPPRSC